MKAKTRSRLVGLLVVLTCLVSTFVYGYVLVDGDFSGGSFDNVYYNSSLSGLVLDYGTTSGSYVSSVYDSLSYASWDFNYVVSDGSVLMLVDKQEDVWKSVNFGHSWFTVNTSFNGVTVDAVDLLFFDNVLYLVDKDEDVFSSSDFGYSWDLVYSDYNGGESQDAKVAGFDSSNFYIFEGDKDVWRSSDLGLNWTKVSSAFTSKEIKGFAYDGTYIYVVDNGAEFWKSNNSGISWVSVNSDYNLGDGNSADDLAYYSGNFYVLDGASVWRSNDSGVNFVKVNDDFNPGDGSGGVSLVSNSDGLFIADASEDVYVSYDGGVSFSLLVSDMNSGSNGVVSMLSYDVSSVDFSYSVSDSRYFSYAVNFSSLDIDYSPIMHNVTVSYNVLNTAPNYSISFSEGIYSGNVSLNVSVWDYDGNSSYVWFYGDSAYLNYSYVLNGSSVVYYWNVSEGNHSWYVVVNDSDSVVSSVYDFSVDFSSPLVLINVSSANVLFGEYVYVNYSVYDLNLDSVYFNVSLDGVDIVVSNLSSGYYVFNSSGNYTFAVFANDSLGHFSYTFGEFFIGEEIVDGSNSGVSTSSGGGGRRVQGFVLDDGFSPNVLIPDLEVETSPEFDDGFGLDLDSASDVEFVQDVGASGAFNRFTGATVQLIGTDEAKYVLLVFGLIFVFSVGYNYGLHHISKRVVKRKYRKKNTLKKSSKKSK